MTAPAPVFIPAGARPSLFDAIGLIGVIDPVPGPETSRAVSRSDGRRAFGGDEPVGINREIGVIISVSIPILSNSIQWILKVALNGDDSGDEPTTLQEGARGNRTDERQYSLTLFPPKEGG